MEALFTLKLIFVDCTVALLIDSPPSPFVLIRCALSEVDVHARVGA